MSDEQYKGDEPEVEAHSRRAENIEADADADDEVEAHVRKANARMD
jgi:hypothetical protein